VATEERAFLLSDSASFIGKSFGFLRTSPLFEQYPRLVREGGGLTLSDEDWQHVTLGSSAYVEPAVDAILTRLRHRDDSDWTVLDVGCGRGDYTATLLELCPQATAVAIDPTPAVAKEAADRLAGSSRAEVRCCQVDAVPETFDVILLNHVIHVVGEGESRRILRECRRRLRPGGALFVQELVATEANRGALFGLMMRLLFPAGRIFSPGQLEALLREAELSSEPPVAIGSPESGLVLFEAHIESTEVT
jgi:SAM-dependent methyltransferase